MSMQQQPAPLSEVMKRLQQGVEGIKKATLARVAHPRQNVAEYAGATVELLGEIEAAMENVASRIAELEGVDFYDPRRVEDPGAGAAPSFAQ